MGFSCLTKTNLAPILLSRSVWKWFCFGHRRRTCDDYFLNSLRPISYLGLIWDLYVCVRPENQNHRQGTHSDKTVLIVRPKIPKMPQKFSAQFVYPSPKVWDFIEERLHWVSVVRSFDCWIGSRIFNIDNEFAAIQLQWNKKTQNEHLNIVSQNLIGL